MGIVCMMGIVGPHGGFCVLRLVMGMMGIVCIVGIVGMMGSAFHLLIDQTLIEHLILLP